MAVGTQVENDLMYDDTKVFGKGTFIRTGDEVMKTFWVRVCQRDHMSGVLSIAEESVSGESTSVFEGPPDNRWTLNLPTRQGSFQDGDGSASAVLVFESGGDLFTLAWAECVHLHQMGSG